MNVRLRLEQPEGMQPYSRPCEALTDFGLVCYTVNHNWNK